MLRFHVSSGYNAAMPAKGSLLSLLLLTLILPVSAPPRPRTIFFDDFDGHELDRFHWNVIVTGQTVNNEQQAYVDSEDVLSVDGGALTIRPRFREGFTSAQGRRYDFISGRIDTRSKVSFTYGTAAARMKLAAGAGLWPAFWALGDGRWPDTGEIDIMENIGDATWISVGAPWSGILRRHAAGQARAVHRASRRHRLARLRRRLDARRAGLQGGRPGGLPGHARDGREPRPLGVRQSQAPDPEPGAWRQLSGGRQRNRRLRTADCPTPR